MNPVLQVLAAIVAIVASGSIVVGLGEWLLVRLHDEDWLLERAAWTHPSAAFWRWDGPLMQLSRADARGMVPVNMEARELCRRWAGDDPPDSA